MKFRVFPPYSPLWIASASQGFCWIISYSRDTWLNTVKFFLCWGEGEDILMEIDVFSLLFSTTNSIFCAFPEVAFSPLFLPLNPSLKDMDKMLSLSANFPTSSVNWTLLPNSCSHRATKQGQGNSPGSKHSGYAVCKRSLPGDLGCYSYCLYRRF